MRSSFDFGFKSFCREFEGTCENLDNKVSAGVFLHPVSCHVAGFSRLNLQNYTLTHFISYISDMKMKCASVTSVRRRENVQKVSDKFIKISSASNLH